MGLFGGKPRAGGMMDQIRCDEPSYLIWKWHPYGSESGNNNRENAIRWGSSLRVKDGEVAVFVYNQPNGKMQDFIEGPFDEKLRTKNLPILASIVGTAYQGGTPFQAEVYFINLAKIIQIPFGVPYFDIYDPRFLDFGVPTAVRGRITFNIANYYSFIKLHRLQDFNLNSFQKEVRDSVARYVKGIVTNVPAERNIPVVQIEREISSVNARVEEEIRERFENDFGVNITAVDIEAIEIEVFSPKVFNTVENNSYIVYHYKQNIYDDNFTLVSADTENLIARVNSTLTPPVKTYTGFTSPDTQNLFISYQNPNVVEYRYTRNSYTVTVQNTTGFNGTPTGGGSYKYQADVTVNCALLAGYSFEGWTSPDYSGWTNSSYSASFSMPAQDVTMKANAKIIPYSISYTLNGGTVATANPTGYDVTSATITLNNPTRKGYTFAGWTGSNGTSPQTTVTIPTGSINNKSYTANWNVVTYGITYTSNGGSVATANPTTYNIETNNFTLNNPTRAGYTFTGWSGTGLSGTANTSVTITKGSTEARSYTANWSANTVTYSS